MSRTSEIGCTQCMVMLWVGQGSGDGLYLYSTPEHMKKLRDFIVAHEGHLLVFGDSEQMSYDFDSVEDSD